MTRSDLCSTPTAAASHCRLWLCMVIPPAHAQFAVIDVASLTQLVSQVQTLEQQLATARGQLTQAQASYQSMTGSRGMEQLLAAPCATICRPTGAAAQLPCRARPAALRR